MATHNHKFKTEIILDNLLFSRYNTFKHIIELFMFLGTFTK